MYSVLIRQGGEKMLNFGMETKRVNDIINAGAKKKLTDLAFLEREITKWLASPERKMMLTGDA